MKFTTELPNKAGAYGWRSKEGNKPEFYRVEFEGDLAVFSACGRMWYCHDARGEWSGPMLAPEECVTNERHQEAWQIIADMKAMLATTIPREVFAKEVEAAFAEGHLMGIRGDNIEVVGGPWGVSRAHRVANGKEGV